jgi:hypothetical protein
MIWLTPAFSVYTCACRACSSSQRPFALLPVKSMMRTSGRSASSLRHVAAGIVREQRDDVGVEPRFGEHLARDAHGHRKRQDRAGCGFTITRCRWRGSRTGPGSRSTVGNVQQPTTSRCRAGTTRKRFSMRMGSFLPCGFSHCAERGHARQLVPRVGDGLEAAVLRVRAARPGKPS